jgi:hypothetical protein
MALNVSDGVLQSDETHGAETPRPSLSNDRMTLICSSSVTLSWQISLLISLVWYSLLTMTLRLG